MEYLTTVEMSKQWNIKSLEMCDAKKYNLKATIMGRIEN